MDRFHFVSFALALAALFSACAAPAQPQNVPSTVTAQVDQGPVLSRPAAGEVTSNFDGKTNKGLDFAGNLGDPVVAVAAGHVVFAASTMRGYGQMIIIKHNSTHLTAYAHNNVLLVKEGDMVYAGQIVARMGSTETDRVKLHFEVWRNGVSIDPMQYLNRISVAVPVVAAIPPKPAVAPTSQLEPSNNISPSESTKASVKPVLNRTTNAPAPVVDIANAVPRSTFSNSAPPLPEFKDSEARMAYLRWLGSMSERLKKKIPDWPTRKEFLQTVWYEATRSRLDVNLVLGLIEIESNFRKFAVSGTDARGFMQVMPSRTRTMDDGDPAKLFHMQTNLRFGCSILRQYLDAQYGNERRALEQYESENMGFGPVDPKVLLRVMQIQIAKQRFASNGESSSATTSENRPLPIEEKVKPSYPTLRKQMVVTIPVNQDGHYFLKGTINGVSVNFLVDTGASSVAISEELALRANVRGGKVIQFKTASGVENARLVDGVDVIAGPLSVPGGVAVIVSRGLGDNVLLGQRFLQSFVLTMGSGQMVIRGTP